MTVYHGSYVEVRTPDLSRSRANVDFGRGFYLTELYEQAKAWASRFKRSYDHAVLSRYSLDVDALPRNSVKTFGGISVEWFDFIVACRTGQDTSTFDVVWGPVANDRVFNTLELYLEGLLDKEAAMERLRYIKPNSQLCIRSQEVLNHCLTFEGSELL